MNCLMVVAHPINNSLCQTLAAKTLQHLESKGYKVTVKDLYKEQFDPVLSEKERASYYQDDFDQERLKSDISQLRDAQSLVLVFPTWWFGFPAILKGWFDRVWAPGHAYFHASDYGPIKPGLAELKELKVVTTLGSPWWVDWFILRKPVKRVLKTALMGTCSKGCQFKMLSLYNSEKVSSGSIDNFIAKIRKSL